MVSCLMPIKKSVPLAERFKILSCLSHVSNKSPFRYILVQTSCLLASLVGLITFVLPAASFCFVSADELKLLLNLS